MNHQIKNTLLLMCMIFFCYSYAENLEEEKQERFVNLGLDLIPRKKTFAYLNSILYDEFQGIADDAILTTQIAYGFTDFFGIQIFIPVFLRNFSDGQNTKGLGDILLDLQWRFVYNPHYVLLFETALSCPTGSTEKQPVLGTGNYMPFFGLSSLYSGDWLVDCEIDIITPIKRNNRKAGNQVVWEMIFGRRIKFKKDSDSNFYFALLVDGFYNGQNRINGVIDENSGGTLIILGPLMEWWRNNMRIQAGFEVPVVQNLFGNQIKFDFNTYLAFAFDLDFNKKS